MSYETRARLRLEFQEFARTVQERTSGSESAVYDLAPELIAFAKRRILRQLITSYLLSLFTLGVFAGAVGVVIVELVAGLWVPGNQLGAPLNPLTAMLVCAPVMSLLPAAGVAYARGAWRSCRLVRHFGRARREPEYLLPGVD